jgi:polar amino acid transport system substrate-binding protein
MVSEDIDRRSYLKAVGGASVATTLAGCLGGGAGGGGDGGSGGENGSDGSGSGSGSSETLEIVAGTAPGFPPFEIKQDGELTGFDVELFEAVVEASSAEFGGWQEFEFDALIPALRDDNIDAIAAAMTITEDRDEVIDFSEPYYSADQSVIVRADGDFMPESLTDLAGRPVGAQKGTTGESVIQTELIEAGELQQSNYRAYDNYTLAVQDLENGNIDAIVLDQPVGATFEAQRNVTVAFTYETGERYGFGVREGDSETQTAINEGLAAVQDDGTYEELRNKWFGGDSGGGSDSGSDSSGNETNSTA